MGRKRALIIGINEYEDLGFERLKYAEKDARAIYDILINPDIGEFAKEDVVLLTAESKSKVEENIETTLNEAKKDDLVLIYFAGHGKLDKSGNLCLAARNTKADRLLATSIHLEQIRRIIDQSDCRRIVFMIDSCFSGAAGQSFRSGEIPTESFEQISGQGKVIISASQAYERARERDDIGHGIFTYNLVKGLEEGEADHDGDGYISIDELYGYVCDRVKSETRNQQVPMKWGIDEKGDIVIAKSIKNLERKRAEIERLSKIARELQNQGRLDEALGKWNKVIELDAKNIGASQGIKEVEEGKKRRAELEAKIDKLFDYYKKGSIPGTIYNKAVGIIRNPYSNLSGKEEVFTRLVEDLVSNNLSVENFVLSWDLIEKPEIGTDIERLKQEEEHRVEAERIMWREKRHRQKQIATLYEQALELVRVGQWRQALEKMNEIQALNPQFADPEGIVARAQEELEREAEKLEQERRERETREKAAREEAERKAHEERHPSRKWLKIAGAGIIAVIIAAVIVYRYREVTREATIKAPVPPAEILNFVAEPLTIKKGSSSTLEWSTSNAKEVEISGIGKVELSGSRTVSPTETATYTLIATNEEGKTVEREVTVEVTIPPATIFNFGAEPSTIKKGDSSTLEWSTLNAKEVEISGIGKVELSGSKTVSPTETATYTLTATNEEGKTVEREVTVEVNIALPPPEISYFRASQPTIKRGGSSTLEWSTSNTNEAEISSIGNVPLSGSKTVSPTKTTAYILIATNEEGKTEKREVTVKVEIPPLPLPKVEYFKAIPETIEKGKSSALSWKTSNAEEVEISDIGKVSLTGSRTVSPTETTTYTLIARNEEGKTVDGRVTIRVTIEVAVPPVAVVPTDMVQHPERYIKIVDWSFYVAFNGVAIIHHVMIENTSDIAYKDIKVSVDYFSAGTKVSGDTKTLPVTIPPHSKETYLKEGFVLGAASSGMDARNIEVLGAVSLK